jgi:hypothetical protein
MHKVSIPEVVNVRGRGPREAPPPQGEADIDGSATAGSSSAVATAAMTAMPGGEGGEGDNILQIVLIDRQENRFDSTGAASSRHRRTNETDSLSRLMLASRPAARVLAL